MLLRMFWLGEWRLGVGMMPRDAHCMYLCRLRESLMVHGVCKASSSVDGEMLVSKASVGMSTPRTVFELASLHSLPNCVSLLLKSQGRLDRGLRALATFLEDVFLVPGTHMVAHKRLRV